MFGLAVASRSRVGAYWRASAQLEHASVASFARFTLELLRFGAPPDLVADAQRAGLDEVDHAQRCFALASTYAGEPVGPDALPLEGAAALAPDFAGFVEAVVREGCIGETLAALDAAARLANTSDPAVRQVLEAIVADEARHAGLAWRTLRWALTREPALTKRMAAVFEAARAELEAPAALAVADEAAEAHGWLDPAARRRVLLEGFDRVIAPARGEALG